MSLSLAHLTVLDARTEDLIPAAAAGGFDGVGVRIFPGSNPPYVRQIVGDRALISTLVAQSDDLGVPVTDVESFVIGESIDRDRFEAGLETAAALGAKRLLAVSYDPQPDRLVDSLGWLAQRAATYGVRVGLEFIPYSQLRTLPEALAVLAAVDDANAALIIDSLHLSRSGGSPGDLAGLTAQDYAFVQISDARAEIPWREDLPAEARTDRLLPGDGTLWLDALLAALPAGVPLSLEAPVQELSALPPLERARTAGRRTREYLAARGGDPA